MKRLEQSFFERDVLHVAPELLGKYLIRNGNDQPERFMITEVEAYKGVDDLACHASKGRTARTEIMYASGGFIYVYLIYGMYWMLNFVTGKKNEPQAALIRGVDRISGPGRLTKLLNIDKSFYGESIVASDRLWVEEGGDLKVKFITTPRVGVDYSGDIWKNKPWRFVKSD
jgi:DNA-3-methyladenine glycosylase